MHEEEECGNVAVEEEEPENEAIDLLLNGSQSILVSPDNLQDRGTKVWGPDV